ncbi:S-adenosyl-L-methionine-dependent methyltransferase [Venustampulla echinocandica]|uniref:S-adenosyl-L-methionine-dependent methyltransferase n=1 Tax=Venustampulla echinocandica TaxID=2656787 RepID=A0A370TNM7_9HELO|nr:S-adenosyl-L-methionine-dependent methyltransferase [Venustampulla echinocandica]RDL37117.1 S-adenosyl-L-methionine-dependent methyltransferase [Venustampulla echinocandica]
MAQAHGYSSYTTPIPKEAYDKFDEVDNWICDSLVPQDAGLESTLKTHGGSVLDPINVHPNQGKLLYLLAKMNNAKRILEVGTLGGYSAIWLAKALPSGGKVITLELDPKSAAVAESNIKNAGFEDKVEVRVGPALETLEKMSKGGEEKFDLVFIDADKENNPGYFKRALEFSRAGTLIVVDNVVRRGRVVDAGSEDPNVLGIRKLFEMFKNEKRVETTAIQTVGGKGWDGLAFALVVE